MKSIAAIGVGSTGKSSLLNALFGTDFPVHPAGADAGYAERTVGSLLVIDSPPLDQSTIGRAGAYLLVVDKDLTDVEFRAIRGRAKRLAVVLNKADTFSAPQLRNLLRTIRARVAGMLPPERVVPAAADPVRITIVERADGTAEEHVVRGRPQVDDAASVIRTML